MRPKHKQNWIMEADSVKITFRSDFVHFPLEKKGYARSRINVVSNKSSKASSKMLYLSNLWPKRKETDIIILQH